MKNKWITALFSLVLAAAFILNLFTPDRAISETERRKLALFPAFSVESILIGRFFEDFEKYALDQMVYREPFRTLKAQIEYKIFGKYDNNLYFVKDGHAFKMDRDFKLQKYKDIAEKIEKVYTRYLEGMKVYHAFIPDKNYFIREEGKYLFKDYAAVINTLNTNITHSTYIDLFGSLTLDDYYKSDLHWKQDHLGSLMQTLEKAMAFETVFDLSNYTTQTLSPFYGAYHSGVNGLIGADTISYLTNQAIREAAVVHYGENGEMVAKDLYDLKAFSGIDGYDLFLSGPTPIVKIQNASNTSGKSLVIFRDSFASSLAPLLMAEYSTITLIDLRYINIDLIGDYVTFDTQDVLFLYSMTNKMTAIIRDSGHFII